ncbi:hypothetical protein NMG60_11000214 [Bertholletia excelsa]
MASEITEENEEALFTISAEARKEKIRRIIEHQKAIYASVSSSSSFSSVAASCSSFSSSRRSSSLLDLMKEGSTSLRRLFVMEHASLATHFNENSGSPVIKPIPLWGSDVEDGTYEGPWNDIKLGTGLTLDSSIEGPSVEDAKERVIVIQPVCQDRRLRTLKHKLPRKRSFRKLPRFSFWRFRGFGFRLKLRKIRIIICGRKF